METKNTKDIPLSNTLLKENGFVDAEHNSKFDYVLENDDYKIAIKISPHTDILHDERKGVFIKNKHNFRTVEYYCHDRQDYKPLNVNELQNLIDFIGIEKRIQY